MLPVVNVCMCGGRGINPCRMGRLTNYLFADGHAGSVLTSALPVSFEDGDLDGRPVVKYKLRQK